MVSTHSMCALDGRCGDPNARMWLPVEPCRAAAFANVPTCPPHPPTRLAAGSEQVKNVNKNNAVHAIVFEAVAVAIALEEPELMAMGVALLAKFLSVRVLFSSS